MSIFVTFAFPMPLQPQDRHVRLEDPLDEFLSEHDLGELTGGGTFLNDDRSPSGCDITIRLNHSSSIARVTEKLNELGALKGSTFQIEDGNKQEFGSNEGLALFLDTSLPDEVMERHDVGDLFQVISECLTDAGQWLTQAQTQDQFILYFYGPSFELIKQRLHPLLDKEPLMENALIRQIF